jgi:ubiquinone/menaquinone biosynthesis C-methylase UbiE
VLTIDFNKLNIKSGYRILDIGCGSGRHTCGAARFKQVTVIGVDINPGEVNEAKKRLEFQEKTGLSDGCWNVLVADINRLPFDDNFFDLVICTEVLEHISDQKSAVHEVVRVLKPGMDAAVSVPRYWPEQICWRLSEEYRSAENGHIRIYKKAELVKLLEQAGLKHWTSHYAHSLHSPYWWIKCLVGPSKEDSRLVNLYHRFLTWDILKRPAITLFLDRLLNPVLGKSAVLYLRKDRNDHPGSPEDMVPESKAKTAKSDGKNTNN